jgi:hypothetical protein
MNYRVLFFTIAIVFISLGSVLFFVISAGAKQTQNAVLEQSERVGLNQELVKKGLFAFGQPSYFTNNHSCTPPFADEVYATLVMSYETTPRSCSIFVNGKLIHTEYNLKPECIGQCPYEDFSRTIYVDKLDVRDNHEIEMCCNGICIEKGLSAVCR